MSLMNSGVTRERALKQVGAGWKSLIDKFYDAIDDSIHVAQVKEKFGGLRIYFDHLCARYDGKSSRNMFNCEHNYDHLHEIVSDLEEKSFKICEFCGEPGEPQPRRNWIKTLCKVCVELEK
jgi:RNA polymerase-binding transcription factor DksA